jgi:hypothetical protein
MNKSKNPTEIEIIENLKLENTMSEMKHSEQNFCNTCDQANLE